MEKEEYLSLFENQITVEDLRNYLSTVICIKQIH